MRRQLLVTATLLLAAACGRVDFDGLTTAPDGACTINCQPFSPPAGNCERADVGPFVEVGSFPTQGSGYGLWSAPPFLFAADTTGGLHNLRFDGTTFTQVGNLSSLGWVEAVFGDGQQLFVSAPGTGLAVVDAAADGTLSVRTQNTTAVPEARRGWAADGLLYIPNGGSGLTAMRLDGTTLVQVGASTPTQGWGQGAWTRGSRTLFSDGDVFRIVDFDGATFTDVITPDTRHRGGSRTWSHDGTTIFLAGQDGATAFRLVGTTLVELDTFRTPDTARDIWSDGTHVFVAASTAGIYALAFENDHFTQLDRVDLGGLELGVFGDGTYIYANGSTGVHAFAGFTCLSASAP